jgi:transcriptional regulator with XRE-family HTH domain
VEVTKLRAEGRTQVEVAAELGIHRNTVGKLEKKSMEELISTDQINRAEYQKRIVAKLESILEEIELHRKSGKPLGLSAIDRQIHASLALAKLTGASAPSRAVVGHVSAEVDLRFKKATSGLTVDQMEQVYGFAAGLPREKREVIRDASWFPKPEPTLLEGDVEAVPPSEFAAPMRSNNE